MLGVDIHGLLHRRQSCRITDDLSRSWYDVIQYETSVWLFISVETCFKQLSWQPIVRGKGFNRLTSWMEEESRISYWSAALSIRTVMQSNESNCWSIITDCIQYRNVVTPERHPESWLASDSQTQPFKNGWVELRIITLKSKLSTNWNVNIINYFVQLKRYRLASSAGQLPDKTCVQTTEPTAPAACCLSCYLRELYPQVLEMGHELLPKGVKKSVHGRLRHTRQLRYCWKPTPNRRRNNLYYLVPVILPSPFSSTCYQTDSLQSGLEKIFLYRLPYCTFVSSPTGFSNNFANMRPFCARKTAIMALSSSSKPFPWQFPIIRRLLSE